MDMIVEFFEILFNIYMVLCVIFTTLLLWAILPHFTQLRRDIKQEFDRIDGIAPESNSVEPNVKFVKIESHGTLQYMFDAISDKFVCQAATEDELWETAQKLNSEYKLVLVTEEIIMSGDNEIKITFAPGCFDEFEGSQEELDELLNSIREMAASGELFENAEELDLDDLDDTERKALEKALSVDVQRKLH